MTAKNKSSGVGTALTAGYRSKLITRGHAAELLGVGEEELRRYERGECEIPDAVLRLIMRECFNSLLLRQTLRAIGRNMSDEIRSANPYIPVDSDDEDWRKHLRKIRAKLRGE